MTFKNKKMYLGGINADSLAKKYGTPLYVYEANKIRERFADFTDNIKYKKLRIHYAVKANNNIQVLKLLRKLGANVETVSIGAINIALKADFKPNQIIHTCNGMTDDELKFLIRNKITTNIDSLSQLTKWGRFYPNSKISLRLNLKIGAGRHTHQVTGGDESKFGIHISNLEEALEIAKKYKLKIVGLQHHIGTDAFLRADTYIRKVVRPLFKIAEGFEKLEFLDFGGSIGFPYEPTDKPMDMKSFGKKFTEEINDFMKRYKKNLNVILEPGRYLVAESGTLLATVTDIKENPANKFISINSGFNHLIRPAMYWAYHNIVNTNRVSGKEETVHIVGNICESADFFARDRKIAATKEGDILAILNTGAYGYSMSSNYNSRPKPAEVLVSNGKSTIIRKREKL